MFRSIVFLLHPVLLLSLFVTACTPVRPVVRDGAGNELPLLNQVVESVTLVATVVDPIDSIPAPDGTTIYFTALSAEGPGLFQVAATGGAVEPLVLGDPLQSPRGLALSPNGQTLFVADPGAQQIWSIRVTDGTVTAVDGTAGIITSGVETDGTQLYFTGSRNGVPGLWTVGTAGGELTTVIEGAPLVNPMGITVASDGALYLVDHDAGGNGMGAVFQVVDGKAAELARDFRAGHQAGVALTLDEQILLVSALDVQRERAQVLLINLQTLAKGVVTKGVAANDRSGGVHRAHDSNLFAWADGGQPIQKPGHVYVIRPGG